LRASATGVGSKPKVAAGVPGAHRPAGAKESAIMVGWKGWIEDGYRRYYQHVFRDDTAETCLFVYSMTAAARHGRSAATDTVEAQPLVLLRSLVEMQKKLIEALYAE